MPISNGIIYSMFKRDHTLAGYKVKLADNHVMPHAHARSGMSSKVKLKWAIPIAVIAVIAGILLVLFVFFR